MSRSAPLVALHEILCLLIQWLMTALRWIWLPRHRMLRIPNPGSDIDAFVRIFRDLYPFLSDNQSFSLDEITAAMVAKRNVTSQGAIGEEALRRSTREDRSLDPLYNQSKMYSELYRILGWIHSTDSNLKFCISPLGHHIATAVDPRPLVKECLIGMAYPSEVLAVQGDQTIRIFGCALRALSELGTLTRDELIAGPMSMDDDVSDGAVDQMISDLRKFRSTAGGLKKRLAAISKQRKITLVTMGNYTRFPMAAFVWAGWATKPKLATLVVTAEGREAAQRLTEARDFRLSDFKALREPLRRPLVVSTHYRMLERSGFGIDGVREGLMRDETTLGPEGLASDVMFSPFQQLSRTTVAAYAPELLAVDEVDTATAVADAPGAGERRDAYSKAVLLVQESGDQFAADRSHRGLVETLRALLARTKDDVHAASELFAAEHANDNRDVFYPLVADLFSISGFSCRISRAGVNYARADAMIEDARRSIPVEIKSPGEEREISVKGVRQATENKVVLLSRNSFQTTKETTTLVVGFNPPNERSEVYELIDDIHRAYGFNIGVLDFRTLTRIALQCVREGRVAVIPNFYSSKGLIRVEASTPGR